MYRTTTTQFAGFVKNKKTGEYDQMFTTEIGERLAKERAIGAASDHNMFIDDEYDIDDVLVKQRVVTFNYGDWEEVS